jgi:hypothetical protein
MGKAEGSDSGFHKRDSDTARYKRSRNLEERNELGIIHRAALSSSLLLKAVAEPPRMKFMTYGVAFLDPQTMIHSVEGERDFGHALGYDLEPLPSSPCSVWLDLAELFLACWYAGQCCGPTIGRNQGSAPWRPKLLG